MEISIETGRLIIRSIRTDDLVAFLEYRSDPRVCEFQGFSPMTEEKARRFIQGNLDKGFGGPGEWIQLGVEMKGENKLIGDIGLKPEGHDTRVVEFGVSFSPRFQKKGLAREALNAVFDLLFTKVGTHRIVGITDVKNKNCINLMENLGFRREAEFRQSFWDENRRAWRDEYLYAMLQKDWKAALGQAPKP